MGKMRSSIMLLERSWDALRGGVYSPGGCMIGKRQSTGICGHSVRWARKYRNRSRTASCMHRQRDFAGRDYFSVSECRRGGKCPVCRCGSGGADGSAGMRAGTGDWTAVPFPKWNGGIDPGIGTDALIIEGGLPLHDSRFVIGGDRIVAGTYLLAAASCSGEVIVDGVQTQELRALTGCWSIWAFRFIRNRNLYMYTADSACGRYR